jgi:hypothetical protein
MIMSCKIAVKTTFYYYPFDIFKKENILLNRKIERYTLILYNYKHLLFISVISDILFTKTRANRTILKIQSASRKVHENFIKLPSIC